ncbi:MAG: two component transcriptional regulator, LuxR family [Chloroflexi bacterium]|jgi:DNA-binding NarL/FixJ family response regulator|nr:two component transcriptional regulator, LuxR family [Chloroflexota bacterium]
MNNNDPDVTDLKFNPERTATGNKGIRSIGIVDQPRVLVVDSQPLFLRGVNLILKESAEFGLVTEALNGQQALIEAENLLPDVILCSINLPDIGGLEVCRAIRRRLPQTSVILFSETDDDEQLFSALRAGAAGYFDKNISSVKLIEIVRQVVKGNYLINEQVILKPVVAKRVLQQFNELIGTEENEIKYIFAPLTGREIAILDSIARGNSNKEIGIELVISDQTVKNHITNILRKLNANDRTQAVITGIRNGWISI